MLAMLVISGAAMAQNDTPFVIKKGGNYLAHVKVGENYVLQNAESFNPATCLWYSGPTYNPTGYTHNYYFEDDAHNLRFLAARCLRYRCCVTPTNFIISTTGTPNPL